MTDYSKLRSLTARQLIGALNLAVSRSPARREAIGTTATRMAAG